MTASSDRWPELPLAAWRDTRDTLHLWTQVVGKIRLALAPWLNHSWHVALYVTARGLATSPMPWRRGSLRDRIRLRRSRAMGAPERRPFPPADAPADDGGEILRRSVHRAGRTRRRHLHPHHAVRNPRLHPLRSGQLARGLRSRLRQPLLARVAHRARGVRAFPHRFSRQGEPGAFLLGQRSIWR